MAAQRGYVQWLLLRSMAAATLNGCCQACLVVFAIRIKENAVKGPQLQHEPAPQAAWSSVVVRPLNSLPAAVQLSLHTGGSAFCIGHIGTQAALTWSITSCQRPCTRRTPGFLSHPWLQAYLYTSGCASMMVWLRGCAVRGGLPGAAAAVRCRLRAGERTDVCYRHHGCHRRQRHNLHHTRDITQPPAGRTLCCWMKPSMMPMPKPTLSTSPPPSQMMAACRSMRGVSQPIITASPATRQWRR